ncbi:MAG: hypothetical protein KA771_10990 [Spirochaetales bacterium]|nr:hypothetical protein [Spirochaetales bacterium]
METYIYIHPISTDDVQSDQTIGYYQFRHNTENDIDEFLGYEIYYKLYAAGSDTILQDRTALEDLTYIGTESSITSRGFVRLRFKEVDDTNKPLLLISPGQRSTSWVFKLDFSPLTTQTPKEPPVFCWLKPDGVTTELPPIILLRAAREEDLEEETFEPDQFLSTDPDVVSMNVKSVVENKEPLSVVFCVASFGRDVDGTYLYSTVVFLNRNSYLDDVVKIDLDS